MFDYLAAGETVTLTYTVAIDDGDGGTTITVDSTDAIGAVTEDGQDSSTLSDTGTIAFNDVDLIDVHTTSVTPRRQHARRHSDPGVGRESATTEPGTVGWTYTVANSATQYLAVDQTASRVARHHLRRSRRHQSSARHRHHHRHQRRSDDHGVGDRRDRGGDRSR